jgi:hypothetical protein
MTFSISSLISALDPYQLSSFNVRLNVGVYGALSVLYYFFYLYTWISFQAYESTSNDSVKFSIYKS